jgi:hypothetical protein
VSTNKLTVNDIRNAVAHLKKHNVRPRRCPTQEEVEYLMAQDKKYGLHHHWKIGDYYYVTWGTVR